MSGGNRHGCLVAIDGRGVLILGAARSGKSALALCLIRLARREGRQAALSRVFAAPHGRRDLCAVQP